ncbi:MAG: hypothetical protein V9G04_17455 [Nocardioides sp.]|jgi:hypothetical protein
MSEPSSSDRRTEPTDESIDSVLSKASLLRREQAETVLELMESITGEAPVAWGSMIGCGTSAYLTADGKTHETFALGLAARKAALTLYGLTYYGSNTDLLDRLGPHTTDPLFAKNCGRGRDSGRADPAYGRSSC